MPAAPPRSAGAPSTRHLPASRASAPTPPTSSAEPSGGWILGEGDSSLFGFLKSHWIALLGCVVCILGGVFFVRFVRAGLDTAISRSARNVPELRSEPVTVRAEEAHAKREKAEQELAAKEAEEEALRMVSKEEAGKAQRMGEGGYGGGDE